MSGGPRAAVRSRPTGRPLPWILLVADDEGDLRRRRTARGREAGWPVSARRIVRAAGHGVLLVLVTGRPSADLLGSWARLVGNRLALRIADPGAVAHLMRTCCDHDTAVDGIVPALGAGEAILDVAHVETRRFEVPARRG